MSKRKTVKPKKQIEEIINRVKFKHNAKKVKQNLKEKISEKINNFGNKNPPLVSLKTKNKKNEQKEVRENVTLKEKVETVIKKNKKIMKKLSNKTDEDNISLVTPKKNKTKKNLFNKELQNSFASNKKLKIKKFKSKSETRHLIENIEASGCSTPVEDNKRLKTVNTETLQKRKKQVEALEEFVSKKPEKKPVISLRQKMMGKLDAARFRFINEQIYTTDGKEAEKLFRNDSSAFEAYHKGFRQQVNRWPMNPLDKVIKMINKMPKSLVIADFGCGEAKLAQSVQQKVYSFDLVAANQLVTACNMAHVPLENESVDVAVFCLSLMGTNLKDYLIEANRVLKSGGILKVVEVESRFDNVEDFIKNCKAYGFTKTWMDLSHNLFYFLDFKKTSNTKERKKLPGLSLKPCIYKKR